MKSGRNNPAPLQPRPVIASYEDPIRYLQDMLVYLRQSDQHFSVLSAARNLRRVSPALVSLILKRKRKITLDRVEEFAQLLRLTLAERYYFKRWMEGQQRPKPNDEQVKPTPPSRREVTHHILNDWLNVYVKDYFQIQHIRDNPQLLMDFLKPIASSKRVEKALKFLLREGHLRKTLDGKMVLDVNLTVTDPKVSSQKIRQFHKSALNIARSALDLYPIEERLSNTLLVPLNEATYKELLELVEEFAEKLKEFAARKANAGDRLYQLIVNLSPIGGKNK